MKTKSWFGKLRRVPALLLVTAGVAQSNSVRQIAAAATVAGLGCCVVQFTHRSDGTPEAEPPTGNAFIIRLLGAEIVPHRWTGDRVEAVEAAAADAPASRSCRVARFRVE